MEGIEKITLTDDRHYDYSCSYTEGKPANGFEFRIYNKKNNQIRAKVTLDEVQMIGLMKSLATCLADDDGTE